MESATVAQAMSDVLSGELKDPAQKTDQALQDYRDTLKTALDVALRPDTLTEAALAELLRRSDGIKELLEKGIPATEIKTILETTHEQSELLKALRDQLKRTIPLERYPRENTDTQVGANQDLSFVSAKTDFVGRHNEMSKLHGFAQSVHQALWWQVAGPGGMGKSRLAREFVQDLNDSGWHAGFIAAERLNNFDWADYTLPDRLCIVIDYVALDTKAEQFGALIRNIQQLSLAGKKLRILVLERDAYHFQGDASSQASMRTWITPLLGNPSVMGELLRHIYKVDGIQTPKSALELIPLKRTAMEKVVVSLRRANGASELNAAQMAQLFEALEGLDVRGTQGKGGQAHWRPLFVMLLAEVFDPATPKGSPLTLEALLKQVQSQEMKTWPSTGSSSAKQNGQYFAVLATLIGGLDWNALGNARNNAPGLQNCPFLNIGSAELDDTVTWAWRYIGRSVQPENIVEIPLDPRIPDILGEYFVLNALNDMAAASIMNTDDALRDLLRVARAISLRGILEFLFRAQADFPHHKALDMLRKVIPDDIGLLPEVAAALGLTHVLQAQYPNIGNALVIAAELGHTDTVRALITKGENSDKVHDQNGTFPLLMAAQEGHAEAVAALIKADADVDRVHDQNGTFPLLLAAQQGHAEVVAALIKADADVDRVHDQNGTFPLLLAAQQGHAEVVAVLIEAEADVDRVDEQDGSFPLLVATIQGHIAIVEALVLAGADVNQRYEFAGTALEVATEIGHTEIAQILRKHGAVEE